MSIAAPPRRLSPMTPRNASECAPDLGMCPFWMTLPRWARCASNCSLLCGMHARRVMPSLLAIRIQLRCRRCAMFCRKRTRRECVWFLRRKWCTEFHARRFDGWMEARRVGACAIGENISVVFLCFFVSFLFSFRFFHAHFRGALLQRGLREKTFGKTRIVFAGLKENLVDAAAVAVERDLQRGPHAVHQLIIRVDARFHAAVGRSIVLQSDDAAHQVMSRAVYRQAEIALFAIGDFDTIHSPEIYNVGSADADAHSRLFQACAQQVVDVPLGLLLKIGNSRVAQLGHAALIECPAAVAVIHVDDDALF